MNLQACSFLNDDFGTSEAASNEDDRAAGTYFLFYILSSSSVLISKFVLRYDKSGIN